MEDIPFLAFPSEEHVSRHDFASSLSVLSCLSARYCQLCFLVSLFSVSLCFVLYLEIIKQVSSASPIPLDFVLQYFRVPKEGQHFRRSSLPSMMPHLPPGPGWWAAGCLGPANRLSGSFPISSPTGCPWSNNLSMSVGLSVVLFSCLVVALCFIFKKKKKTAPLQRLTSRLCYWRAAAPLSWASPLPRATVWSNSMTVCDCRMQQLDL